MMEVFYEELVPGKSVSDLILSQRILEPQSFAALTRWRVAVDDSGNFLGAMNCMDHRVLMESPDEPLLDAARLRPIAGLLELEATAPPSYYVNIIAVYRPYRGRGVGHELMREAERLARLENFERLCLCTFDTDDGPLAFYRRLGFEVVDTRPITPHPAIGVAGNFVLMAREL